jgi:hypothetical protein
MNTTGQVRKLSTIIAAVVVALSTIVVTASGAIAQRGTALGSVDPSTAAVSVGANAPVGSQLDVPNAAAVQKQALAPDGPDPALERPAVGPNSPAGSQLDAPASRTEANQPNSIQALVNSYYRILGTGLQPIISTSTYSYDIWGCQSAAVAAFHAPIYLPDGAVIKYLRVYYRNNVSGSTQSGTGYILSYDGAAQVTLATVVARSASVVGSTGLNSDVSAFSGQTIDNLNNGYTFLWWPGGTNQSLCGFRINYDRPYPSMTIAPSILKP